MWQLRLNRHQNQCGYFTDKYDAGVSLACLGEAFDDCRICVVS